MDPKEKEKMAEELNVEETKDTADPCLKYG